MAKETIVKENPVIDALRKLKEEAIGALEKILDKSSKKAKPAKDASGENATEETAAEPVEEAAQ